MKALLTLIGAASMIMAASAQTTIRTRPSFYYDNFGPSSVMTIYRLPARGHFQIGGMNIHTFPSDTPWPYGYNTGYYWPYNGTIQPETVVISPAPYWAYHVRRGR